MEDSFNVRVGKIFGSLGGGGGGDGPSSGGASLWCLTDEEVERRQWNRHKGEEDTDELRDPSESDLQELSELDEEDDQEEIEDEEEEEEEEEEGIEKKRGGDILDEDWDVRSNIGRDCTLDFEDEEDEYDKVAVGTEQSGDRIYMKDVKYADYEIDEVNTYGELPTSFRSVARDPRANHLAAKNRLKEDAEASQNFDNLHLFDNSVAISVGADVLENGESDADIPKPILKKREGGMDSRSQKRVRFSFDTKSGSDSEDQPSSKASDPASDQCPRNDITVPELISESTQYSSGVPDYVRNPSKYTCYTLDSADGDIDSRANQKAYLDFLQYVGKKDDANDLSQEDDIFADNPTSVTFVPKKKREDDTDMISAESNSKENLMSKGLSIGVEEDEVSRMEEDEPSEGRVDKVGSLQKAGGRVRQYRSRENVDVDDNEDNSTPT